MDTAEYVDRLANQVFSAAMRELPKGIQHETAIAILNLLRVKLNEEMADHARLARQ